MKLPILLSQVLLNAFAYIHTFKEYQIFFPSIYIFFKKNKITDLKKKKKCDIFRKEILIHLINCDLKKIKLKLGINMLVFVLFLTLEMHLVFTLFFHDNQTLFVVLD